MMLRSALAVLPVLLFAPRGAAQALLEPPPSIAAQREAAALDSVPDLVALARRQQDAGDWQGYAATHERLLKLRPQAGRLRYELAAAYARLDDKQRALDQLVRLQSGGWGFDPSDDPRFATLKPLPVWDFVTAGLEANRRAFGSGKVAFELPAEDLLIESIAYDPSRTAFLVGSVRTGEVLRVDGAGRVTTFIAPDAQNGLWSVLDLAVDANNDLLWVATAALPHARHGAPADLGRAALVKFRLSSGELVERAELPAAAPAHLPASVATDGRSAFVADVATNRILRYGDGGWKLIMQHPKITALRGVTLSGDGRTLYFADHEQGIFGIDLGTGSAFDLRASPNASMFGIDALYWYDGTLIAIQNGMVPRRIIRYTLDRPGRLVRRIQTLDGGRPELAAMTRGTVAGDRFYVIANSQKDKYDRNGVLVDARRLEKLKVFASDARFAFDLERGEVRNAPRQ